MKHDSETHTEREPRPDELLVMRYVDGELRPSELRELEARLLEEPALVRVLEHAVRARSWFRAQQPVPAPLGAGFADRLFRALTEQEPVVATAAPSAAAGPASLGTGSPPQTATFDHTLRVWALVAASLLLILSAFALFARSGADDGTMHADDAPAVRARTLEQLDARARALEAAALSPAAAPAAKEAESR